MFYAAMVRGKTLSGRREFGMRKLMSKFLQDQSGATAIEYAIIAGGLSIVILAAVNGIGVTLSGKFNSVNSSLK
jgi:pilus assembly protein Flp/PilA